MLQVLQCGINVTQNAAQLYLSFNYKSFCKTNQLTCKYIYLVCSFEDTISKIFRNFDQQKLKSYTVYIVQCILYYIRFIILCILIPIHSVYESETFIVYTVYIILCILYSVYCIILCLLCCVYYTVYTNTVYTILCIKNTNFHHFEVFTKKMHPTGVHCTPLFCIYYSLYTILCILYSVYYTVYISYCV